MGISPVPIWLEYGRGWLASATRFLNDVLLSARSIVIGLFVYSVFVAKVGHFSAWAGALALALIVVPVVVRTTDDMLKLVPNSLREAAMALGAPVWKMITLITYRAASTGLSPASCSRSRHQRRNGAAALHLIEQPVLVDEHGRTDGQSAGRDLPVRIARPGLAPPCVGRCADYDRRARAEILARALSEDRLNRTARSRLMNATNASIARSDSRPTIHTAIRPAATRPRGIRARAEAKIRASISYWAVQR